MLSEEERAELWRIQQRNRRAFRRLLNRLLRGDPQVAREIRRDFEPLRRDP